jgi:peroxiredoxin
MTVATGQPAPGFVLPNQHGEEVELASYRGRCNVVLVFYPFAFSRVCTGELCEIRDNLAGFAELDAEVLAISCDHMFSLRAYAESDGLAFSLLSDYWPHGEVSRRYGLFDEQVGCSARATVIVDADGVVRWQVRSEISTPRSLADYHRVLRDLS